MPLRYLDITHSGPRRVAPEDIEVGGSTSPRDARRHVASGFGVHQRLGRPIARAELRIVHGTLCSRVPTPEKTTDFDQPGFRHDDFAHGVYEPPLAW
ncbi:hypothetical protein ACF09H_27535 [Streptomyces sp. NPDC014983]|uniref:hypothetical protein n=1 Tax=Streptomyces sp. NPDC014983 TaxID=3364933 RepID=UPI0036F58623